MFPLQLVIIQGEMVKLHIFEVRYKNMVLACYSQNSTFGIPILFNNEIRETGAEMRICEITKTYENGEMDIVCEAISRFSILDFQQSKNSEKHSQAIVEDLEFLTDENKELNLRLFDLLQEFYELVELNGEEILLKKQSVQDVYHKCGLSFIQELEFADLPSERAMQVYLLQHLKNLLPIMAEVQKMKKLVLLNGHFKKLPQSF